MTVAIVLIDCQNEFAKSGGTLHEDVATIMFKNNMLENIQGLVATARKNGALVIHSTSIGTTRDALTKVNDYRTTYNMGIGEFTSLSLAESFGPNTWNAEIVDELQPLESDIILTRQADSSALQGTELCTIIRERNVEAVILLGFLSDVQVVNTAIDFSDEFPNLAVIICSDGIASTPERHLGAIKKTLPLIGAEVITCNDAIGMFRAGIEDTLHSSQRSETHDPMAKKLNVFEYQSLLQGTGAFIPSTVLISVFTQARADKASENERNDPFFSLSLVEIGQVVSLYAGSHDEVLTKSLKTVAMDFPSVFNFAAGLLLFVGLFGIPDSIASITGGLLANVFYLIAISKSTIGQPINDLKGMVQVERNIFQFKQRIRNEAAAYKTRESFRNRRGSLESTSSTNSVFQGLSTDFVGQMKYIEEEIFSGDAKALTRSEVEMLLLRCLGTSYTPQVLDYVLSSASRSNSTTLNAVEFHQFIASDDEARSIVFDYLRRLKFVLTTTIISMGYLMGLSFFIALCLSIIQWTTSKYDVEWEGFAWTWLYFIGTLGFSHLAYERIRDAHDSKQRAKQLISNCLRYAQYHNRDEEIWKSFRSNEHLDKRDFSKLLENSDISLSESEIESLYREIDRYDNGFITQEEIDHFLHRKENRQLMICCGCLSSFSFLSNLFWFVGANGYAAAYYSSGRSYDIGNIVGAVGYFCGGSAYSIMTFRNNIASLERLLSLDILTKKLLRRFTRRAGVTLAQTLLEGQSNGYSRKTLMVQSIKDSTLSRPTRNAYDEESPNLSDVSDMTSPKEVEDGSDTPEGFLGSLLKRDELASVRISNLQITPRSSCVIGSVYMYQLTLKSKRNEAAGDNLEEAEPDHDQASSSDDEGYADFLKFLTIPKINQAIRVEQVGFLLYPFCYEEVDRIRASIDAERSKLRIQFPIELGGSQHPETIIAELPLDVNVQGTVGKPKKNGTMLHFTMGDTLS